MTRLSFFDRPGLHSGLYFLQIKSISQNFIAGELTLNLPQFDGHSQQRAGTPRECLHEQKNQFYSGI